MLALSWRVTNLMRSSRLRCQQSLDLCVGLNLQLGGPSSLLSLIKEHLIAGYGGLYFSKNPFCPLTGGEGGGGRPVVWG